MYELKITVKTAEELADIAAALETLAAHRIQRAADLAVVTEIQAEVLAGAELDRTLADADANRPLAASAAQLTGRESFMRLECQKLAAAELAAANAAAEAALQRVNDRGVPWDRQGETRKAAIEEVAAVLPNPFEEKVELTFSPGIYEARPNTALEGKPIFIYKAQAGDYYLAKAYNNGVFNYLGAAGRYTAPELRRADQSQFGLETGICGICARELTDPESIARGIGPICKDKI